MFDAENCGTAFDFAAKICDKAIIVTTPDAVSLRSAFDKAEKIRLLSDEARLIVNKVIRSEMEEGRQTKLNDCVDISSVKLLGVVPYDSSAMHFERRRQAFRLYRECFFSNRRASSRAKNVPFFAEIFFNLGVFLGVLYRM